MLYAKSKKLADEFNISLTAAREVRRFIAEHPERYGPYGLIGNLIYIPAFIDAYKCHRTPEDAVRPPYMPEQALELIKGVNV